MSDVSHIVLTLSNLMAVDGTLNEESAARVELGSKIFGATPGSYLFFIGWDYRPDSSIAIADAMKRYQLARTAVPDDRMLINRLSRDSVGDAILSRLDLDARFTRYRLSVVSSSYHLPRLRHIFERVYGTLFDISFEGVEIPVCSDVCEVEAASIDAFEKTFEGVETGDLSAFVRRLLSAHPYYNGDQYPALSFSLGGVSVPPCL